MFALDHAPITSSIIMQILAVVIPCSRSGRSRCGRPRKITQWTRYLTVAIAVMQSTGLPSCSTTAAAGSASPTPPGPDLILNFTVPRVLRHIVTYCRHRPADVDGELITQRGIGNGMCC
ncbi:MAG: hypothetical protein H6518_15045 [Microthrixaceae bacterium]|nr:hypothetical protein [Microthrixaceae bacterium]